MILLSANSCWKRVWIQRFPTQVAIIPDEQGCTPTVVVNKQGLWPLLSWVKNPGLFMGHHDQPTIASYHCPLKWYPQKKWLHCSWMGTRFTLCTYPPTRWIVSSQRAWQTFQRDPGVQTNAPPAAIKLDGMSRWMLMLSQRKAWRQTKDVKLNPLHMLLDLKSPAR